MWSLSEPQKYILLVKGGKDRGVYMSGDAYLALASYLRVTLASREKKLFLVEKGTYKGRPISVGGIQKRMEYYGLEKYRSDWLEF